ncbi:unnamed protein product [Clonostachys rosea f. rosea IK726]|uniref:Uncharacterized protein n=1 Tax=Clonostachys rosea f. rosea IK726 TaxID=1349383 RepID=A0ACA9U953_BIOOC|nr:unnamed protein product [Clonostachys rosea f. rosea IK726]
MPRTLLRDKEHLMIDEGGVEIPFDKDERRSVTFVMRRGTKQTTGLHWHEEKTEYLQVLQGQALVTVGDSTAVFGPNDGVITVPRFTLHEFGRADRVAEGAESCEVDLRIMEWTEPSDGAKEVFFRNMLGVIIDRETGLLGNIKLLLSLFVVMQGHDNYPVFIKGPALFGRTVQSSIRRTTTYVVRGGIALAGRLFGLKATYHEYTPTSLLELK